MRIPSGSAEGSRPALEPVVEPDGRSVSEAASDDAAGVGSQAGASSPAVRAPASEAGGGVVSGANDFWDAVREGGWPAGVKAGAFASGPCSRKVQPGSVDRMRSRIGAGMPSVPGSKSGIEAIEGLSHSRAAASDRAAAPRTRVTRHEPSEAWASHPGIPAGLSSSGLSGWEDSETMISVTVSGPMPLRIADRTPDIHWVQAARFQFGKSPRNWISGDDASRDRDARF